MKTASRIVPFLLLAALLTGLAPSAALAFPPEGLDEDPVAANLFAPELVMRYARRIALEPEQRDRIRAEVTTAQARFSELQWDLQDAAEGLASLLAATHPDEQKVARQLDAVLDAERRVKHGQIQLLVRIKNALTVEQQEQLRELRGSGDTTR